MAEEFDFHPMWESLGMNLADHDMLLGAVGQMYGDMFLTQNNRPQVHVLPGFCRHQHPQRPY